MNAKNSTTTVLAGEHALFLQGLSYILESKFNFSVVAEVNCEEQLEPTLKKEKPQWLFLDLNLFADNFYPLLKRISRKNPFCKVVLFTDHYSVILKQKLEKLSIHGLFGKNILIKDLSLGIKCIAEGERIFVKPKRAHSSCQTAGSSTDELRPDKNNMMALSKREKEILNLICEGRSTIDIGKQLFISKYTVETHRKNILRKLDLRSSTELVSYAYREGLVY